jgi:hypothetical protein
MEHQIRQRYVAKHIRSKENVTSEETAKAAELFQKQTVAAIPDYILDYVTNTSLTGSKYNIKIERTLSHRGENTTEVAFER